MAMIATNENIIHSFKALIPSSVTSSYLLGTEKQQHRSLFLNSSSPTHTQADSVLSIISKHFLLHKRFVSRA